MKSVKMSLSPPILLQVRQEVDALPVQERAALMLVCVKGMRYQDAAQKLGISQEMIKHHLLRSRLTLIQKLNLEGGRGRGGG
jgi:RNA polymerase sigma-70 factor (ECF subfamily)